MEQKLNKALIERLKKKYEQTQEAIKRIGLPVLKLVSGDSATLRIMTFDHDGASSLYHEATLHFLGKVPFACGKMERTGCILCDLADYYKDHGDKKFGNRIRAGTRYFLNSVDYGTGDLVVLSLSLNTFNDLLSYFADDEYRPYLLGKTARNIKITRSGEELDTKYHLKVGMKDMELKEFPEAIDLIDQYPVLSDEELIKRAVELIDVPTEFLEGYESSDGGEPPFDTDGEEFPPEPDGDGNAKEEEEFPANEESPNDEEFPDEKPDPSKKKKTTAKKAKKEDDTTGMNPKLADTLKKLRTQRK